VAAVKVALLDPEATVTDAGTVRVDVFELKPTLAPPEGAVPLRLTVQELELDGPRDAGEQVTPVNVGSTVIEPPVAVIEIPVPAADAPTGLAIPIAALVAPLTMVAETVATVPLATSVSFMPQAMQISLPAPEEQVIDLLAAVRAEPAATEKWETLAVG